MAPSCCAAHEYTYTPSVVGWPRLGPTTPWKCWVAACPPHGGAETLTTQVTTAVAPPRH